MGGNPFLRFIALSLMVVFIVYVQGALAQPAEGNAVVSAHPHPETDREGHGFSRAARSQQGRALAPEGCSSIFEEHTHRAALSSQSASYVWRVQEPRPPPRELR